MTTYGEKTYYSDMVNCPICGDLLVVGTAKIAYDVNTPAKSCQKDAYTLYYAPTKHFAGRYKERRFVYDTYVFYDSYNNSTQFLPANTSKWSGIIPGKHIFADNLQDLIHNHYILQ